MIWRLAFVCVALATTSATAETLAENLATVLRDQIAPCWNVNPADDHADTAVTVVFALASDGRVVGDIVHVDPTDGSEMAFVGVRRAILRCQSPSGYDMPPEHYGLWRNVRLTFDPADVNE